MCPCHVSQLPMQIDFLHAQSEEHSKISAHSMRRLPVQCIPWHMEDCQVISAPVMQG